MTNRLVDENQAPWGDGHSPSAWRMNRRRFLTVAALATGALAGTPFWAQEGATKVRLSLGTSATSAVPVDYLGFSCETAQSADPTFFAADNHDPLPANAAAWAADMPDGRTRLVLLNKDARQKLQISIASAHNATLWRLQAPGLTATSGVTLAGAEFKPGKMWRPTQEINLASKNREVQIEMEPGSGAALFFENGI
jgi:hypothetical protein